MGETKNAQRQTRRNLEEKLALAQPSRALLEQLAVDCASNPSPDNTFQYAFCLSKSDSESELRYAITILDSLVKEGYEHQVDCMYGAATALYLLGDYKSSRERCEMILRSKPDSRLAAELHLASIDAAEAEDEAKVKKMAVAGGAASVAVGIACVAGMLLAKR
mmetsp:Transcript_18562/g.26868  ORF Transcript_18562/g.26868 Transcript_18562/m.26868 type:complete len:163 (+) Transcript_18562:211-699(+)